MGADRLYTEYALCLPRHWIMATANEDGGGGEGGGTNGGLDHGFEGGAGEIDRESGDYAAGGTTQARAWHAKDAAFLAILGRLQAASRSRVLVGHTHLPASSVTRAHELT